MTRKFVPALSLLLLSTLSTATVAQVELSYYLPEGFTYDPRIPTPESIIGHEVGEWHVSHDRLVSYTKAVAEASDRVSLTEYGRTYENRPLLLLAVTSPDNQNRLESIRTTHLQLTGNQADSVNLADQPVVVWLGHSVHGNEASGSNSAMVTLYHLAAAQGPEIEAILDRSVILIDPSINPDGLNRFASWVNSHRGQNLVADGNNLEQNEAWPGGRTNHYWFDLNRDYLPAQLPETRGRLAAIHRWKPNLYTDHHEMGTDSTFFFQPGEPDRIHPLIPEENNTLTEAIADFFQAGLDEIQSLYFSRENYDDYYPGRGPTYVDFNGGVAVLFEQASARSHVQESTNGLLTFPFAIRNHHRSALASVRAAAALRTELLNYQRNYYAEAADLAGDDPVRAYLFGSAEDPARAHHLAEVVKRHEIDIYRLGETVTVGNDTFYPETSYVVPLNQKQYRLIHALFEIRNTFEDSIFYDVSAWTLPLAFNLEYQALDNRAFNSSLLGAPFALDSFPRGNLVGGHSDYAYAFEVQGYYAHRAIHRLLSAGVHLKVGSEPFTDAGGNEFSAGTVTIPMGLQTVPVAEIQRLVETIIGADAIDVTGLATGRSATGPDLGSPTFQTLERPEILILSGDGMSGYEVGQAWHLLDTRFNMTPSLVAVNRFNSLDLGRYNTVVLLDGNYSGVSDTAVNRLRTWNRQGGLIVATKQASRWLAEKELTAVAFSSVSAPAAEDTRYSNYEQYSGSQVIGGSIFRGVLDTTHPLGWGFYRPEVPLFKRGVLVMGRSENPFANPLVYAADSLWSGYVPDGALPAINNSAGIVVSAAGQGKVISFVDDPNFRAFWYGTNKLFLNSLFFGRLIDPATAR